MVVLSGRGLMGAMSRRLGDLGCRVRGVKPRPFLKFEKDHQLPTYGRQTLVDDLQRQKSKFSNFTMSSFSFQGGGAP
jgi:hypothetical protein